MDTAQMQDYLNKASIALSHDLNELLGGESVVAINNQEYSIATEFHSALPAPDTQLKLQNGNGAPPQLGHDGK